MGGRCAIHVPSCGRQTCLLLLVTLLPPQSWPLLIKVYWAIQYGMRYASALASPTFLFPTGTLWALGAFLGGPSCGLRMLFYWICPLVTNFISKLAKIQRQVMLHIMGALRSTLTDVIDACADVLPFHL